jgi:hypothetical protein
MLLAINGVGFTLLSLARLRAHTAYCHWHERVNYFMSAKAFFCVRPIRWRKRARDSNENPRLLCKISMAWIVVDSPVAMAPRMAMPQNSYTKTMALHQINLFLTNSYYF